MAPRDGEVEAPKRGEMSTAMGLVQRKSMLRSQKNVDLVYLSLSLPLRTISLPPSLPPHLVLAPLSSPVPLALRPSKW